MAAEIKTPVCEVTGLPLPLVPYEPPVTEAHFDFSDYHHHFHPRKSPLLEDLGGRAVRHARIQYVPRWVHNRYHQLYEGPPLPADESGQFYMALMAVAGYMPPAALDVAGTQPQIVRVTPEIRYRIEGRNHIKAEKIGAIGSFFLRYALQQGFDHLHESTIEEFLLTGHKDRKRYLGHLILAKAAERATQPIDPLYREVWGKGLISAGQPARPEAVVKRTLGQHPQRYFKALAATLETAAA